MDYVPGNITVERPDRLKTLKLKLIDPIDALDKRGQREKTFHDAMGGK